MDEIEELVHALAHQSEACHSTVVQNQRIHAFQMVAGLAQLESRMLAKKRASHAESISNAIRKCNKCIRSTAMAGKCFDCCHGDLINIDIAVKKEPFTKWHDILAVHRLEGRNISEPKTKAPAKTTVKNKKQKNKRGR
ncbi:MAG: hypothetical protein V1911_01965 [Candidatus Micrarchaeota archaeon]